MAVKLYFGKHAREQMVARGIASGEVEEAIQRGSKQIQHPNKIVAEYRFFAVVYRKQGEGYFIITVKPRW